MTALASFVETSARAGRFRIIRALGVTERSGSHSGEQAASSHRRLAPAFSPLSISPF
jgi:hypothetical protein